MNDDFLLKQEKFIHAQHSIIIANIVLKNRIGLAPINTGLLLDRNDSNGKAIDFYRQYYQSELAFINVGGIAVCSAGRANSSSLTLNSEQRANLLKNIIVEAHANDTKVIVQLEHAGRQTWPNEIRSKLVAPSPIPCPVVNVIPYELSKNDIQTIVKQFKTSANICADIGSDFIEIHAAHGYLLSSFISPATNKRNDEYGGNVFNRFRIIYEIIDTVLSSCSIPIGLRINCTDGLTNGITIDDLCQGLSTLNGKLAYISISAGMYSSNNCMIIPSVDKGPSPLKDLAIKIKKCVNIPVMLAGNITTLSLANNLIKERYADLILIGRSLIADPFMIKKSLAGDFNNITVCNYCNKCKYHSRGKDSIECPFNPVLSSS